MTYYMPTGTLNRAYALSRSTPVVSFAAISSKTNRAAAAAAAAHSKRLEHNVQRRYTDYRVGQNEYILYLYT